MASHDSVATADVDPACATAASDVLTLLTTQCKKCHGGGPANAGGFDFVLDADQLKQKKTKTVEPGSPFVDVANPEQSELYKVVATHLMPLGAPAIDDAGVQRVKDWITCGAPPLVPYSGMPTVVNPLLGYDYVYTQIAADLRASGSDGGFVRYLVLTHLIDAGASDAELTSYRQAAIFLINSLSWNPHLVAPLFVDPKKTILRFSLRDLVKTASDDPTVFWQHVVRQYPYGLVYDHKDTPFITSSLGTDIPFVRADWFAEHASTPPLYHDLLTLPATAQLLEQLEGIDVAADISSNAIARAGFLQSNVSVSNRVIERHATQAGAYWKSYDFVNDVDRRNIFNFPLGPGSGTFAFRHDGGEIIFSLPNGLQAYLVVNSAGKRLDKAPIAIVKDSLRPDAAVVNGLSCMVCHGLGMNPGTDEIRAFVSANASTFGATAVQTVDAQYPLNDVFSTLLSQDATRFQKALTTLGVDPQLGDREKHPMYLLVKSFEEDLDMPRTAAELGLDAQTFMMGLAGHAHLGVSLGPLATGGKIRRDTFESLYRDIVCSLGLGVFIPSTSAVSSPNACGSSVPPALLRDAVTDAFCDWLARCSNGRDAKQLCLAAGYPSTPVQGAGLEDAAVAVETGQATVDQLELSRCVEDLRTAVCVEALAFDAKRLPTCQAAFLSRVAQGDQCVSDVSCPPGTVCLPPVDTHLSVLAAQSDLCESTCVPKNNVFCLNDRQCASGRICVQGLCQDAPELGQEGAPCIDIGAPDVVFPQCEDSLTCLNGRCSQLGGVTQPCELPWNCQLGLFCSLDPSMSTGSCVAPTPVQQSPTVGTPCSAQFDICVPPSLYCDTAAGRCAARPTTGPCDPVSRPCDPTVAFCDATNTCKPTRKEGDNCNPSQQAPVTSACSYGLTCHPDVTGLYRCLQPSRCAPQ